MKSPTLNSVYLKCGRISETVRAAVGFRGGKFLERGRVKKPNQPRYPVEFSKYFTLCDMYIGAVLEVNKFKFELIDADEYAYMYLEKHADEVRTTAVTVIQTAVWALAF